MSSTNAIQAIQLQLLNGIYSPSEAQHLISTIIDKKISLCKSQYLSQWERNHNTSKDSLNAKIKKLTDQKEELMQITKQARSEGRQIKFGGTMELSFV